MDSELQSGLTQTHPHCCPCRQVQGSFSLCVSQGSSGVGMYQSVAVVPHKGLKEFLVLAAGIAELLE